MYITNYTIHLDSCYTINLRILKYLLHRITLYLEYYRLVHKFQILQLGF